MSKLNQNINSPKLNQAFIHIRKKEFEQAKTLLSEGLAESKKGADHVLEALYYSGFGVLYKVMGEFRKAWKEYEKAEKLLPEEPTLQLITSRLLLERFKQNDTVIKKLKKVIQKNEKQLPITHQAYVMMGVAYLNQGKKQQAHDCLIKSMGDHFKGLETATNLDLMLVGELAKKKVALEDCRDYLLQAQAFAKSTREKAYVEVIGKLLKVFDGDYQ